MGRTGRAGDKDGQAHSLLMTPGDAKFAVELMESFALGGQVIVWMLMCECFLRSPPYA